MKEEKIYPADCRWSAVMITKAARMLYCVFSKKTGEILFPNSPIKSRNESGAHLAVCERWAASHSRKHGEIKPGKAQFAVIRMKDGRLMWPVDGVGASMKECVSWIKCQCASTEDMPLAKNLLLKLAELSPGQSLGDKEIIENRVVYEGNRHADFRVVFRQGKKFYSFPYFVNISGFKVIGFWMHGRDEMSRSRFLCRRVYRQERNVSVTEFVSKEKRRKP